MAERNFELSGGAVMRRPYRLILAFSIERLERMNIQLPVLFLANILQFWPGAVARAVFYRLTPCPVHMVWVEYFVFVAVEAVAAGK